MQDPIRWSFGAFDIDPAAGILRKRGEPVRIGRQAFRALALLVSREGSLVTREELQKEIWGDRVHVDFDHGLNVCIRQVRAALGEEGSRIVVTCPREGYRLGVRVTRTIDARRRRSVRWVAAAAAAVLLLVATGYRLIPSDDSSRPEASDWYWRGRAYFDRANGRDSYAALPYFERAAALDPAFAPAQAALAVSYLDRATAGVAATESVARARMFAERALRLAPQAPEAHVALAELRYRVDDDIGGAEREFQRAVGLDGRSAYVRQRYAAFLQDQQRFDAALEQLEVAERSDPLSIVTSSQTAETLWLAGRWEASLAQAYHTLALDPAHPWSFRVVGRCLEALGRRDEAIVAYLKAGSVALGHLGQAYARAGRPAEARALLATLTQGAGSDPNHKGVAIAYIYAGLGDSAAAMEWLEKARQAGRRLPVSLRVAPQWEPLRASSAFPDLLRKHNVGGADSPET